MTKPSRKFYLSSSGFDTGPGQKPPSWPPPPDFPIVVDKEGRIASRFGDPYWNLSTWTKTSTRLSFEEVSRRRSAEGLDAANGHLMRLVLASWIYGPNRVRAASTLVGRYEIIRPLFVLCTNNRISAADLWRFPKIVQQVVDILPAARARETVLLLHEIYVHRQHLGFFILDSNQTSQLYEQLPRHERKQTPYIPPRIWAYIINRNRIAIEEYLANRQAIAELFGFCLAAYKANLADGDCLYRDGLKRGRTPFITPSGDRGARTGIRIHGRFGETANRFGVADLLAKWCGVSTSALKIAHLSQYLSLVSFCGLSYISSFTLCRVGEGSRLRANCVERRLDSAGSHIVLIKGETTKTQSDPNAYWIGSEFCVQAIDALESISLLRLGCAIDDPRTPITEDDVESRPLILRAYEPWIPNSGDIAQSLDVQAGGQSYMRSASRFRSLFDIDELRVTAHDLSVARSVTPSLNERAFQVGKPWPIAWHQLRRTGAVNMASSGLVADQSLQVQLKHSSEAMSRYYAQGYYHLDVILDESGRKEYLSALYDSVSTELRDLLSPTFFSPYGEEHHRAVVLPIAEKSHRELVALAQRGAIPYRSTCLGACTNPVPCPFGGVDTLTACVGDKLPCSHLLVDRRKLAELKNLRERIAIHRTGILSGTPLATSLDLQMSAISRVVGLSDEA